MLLEGQRAASCFSHATAGDFFEDPREQNLNVSSACMFGLSQHPFFSCLSSLKSSICHFALMMVGILAAGLRQNLVEDSCTGTELHCKPTRSVDQLCEMCPSSTLHSSTHCSNDVSVDSVIGFSAGGSEANVTFERQRLHGEGGEGHDCRSPGAEASKEETDTTNDDRVQHCVQFWNGIQCDDQLRNSSLQRNFDTTITSVLSENSSVAPICCGHPLERNDESQTGRCSDDG